MSATPTSRAGAAEAALSCGPLGAAGWLVAPRGEVTLLETRSIEHAVLRGAMDGRRAIVLDLTGVTAHAAGLLGGILRMRRGLGAIGGRLVLVVDGPPMDALVHVGVIEALVEVAPSVDAAAVLLEGHAERLRRPG